MDQRTSTREAAPVAEPKFAVDAPTLARTLNAKLGEVAKLLRAARRERELDSGTVHGLRVTSRRASSALSSCGSLVKRSLRRRSRRWLHEIRDAAAGVRQCDVRLRTIRQQSIAADSSVQPALSHLIRVTEAQRLVALGELAAVVRRRRARRFRRLSEKLNRTMLRRARRLDDATIAALPLEEVRRRCRDMRRASAGDLSSRAGLHELRIAGKKLRYALESLCALQPWPAADELLAELESLQDQLGGINDRYEMAQWLADDAALLALPPADSAGPPSDEASLHAGQWRAALGELAELYRDDMEVRSRSFRRWLAALPPTSPLAAILGPRPSGAHAGRTAPNSDASGNGELDLAARAAGATHSPAPARP